jgi:predicted RecB family nuclease
MKITSQIFLSYLKCNTKCLLSSLGKTGKGNEYAEWLKDRDDSYYSEGTKRLFEGLPQKEYAFPFVRGDLKIARWRLAAGVVVESDFRDAKSPGSRNLLNRSHMKIAFQEHPPASQRARVVLVTNLQAVERLASKRERGAVQYIPIRFIFRSKVTNDDRLLLGFDAMTLSEALGHNVSSGKIIRGDDYTVLRVKTAVLLGKVRKRIEKIIALLESPSPPDLVLNRNCVECEFKPECKQKAIEKDELSLLQGMTIKEREMNHKKGIFTVTQLSYTFRPRRRPKWLREKREKYHHSLKALAIRERKIHVVGNPELKIDGTPICLDVEALPDQGFLLPDWRSNQKQELNRPIQPLGRQY